MLKIVSSNKSGLSSARFLNLFYESLVDIGDINKLAQCISDATEKHVAKSSCLIILGNRSQDLRALSGKIILNQAEINQLRINMSNINDQTLLTSRLKSGNPHFRKLIDDLGIKVIVKIKGTAGQPDIAYWLLGAKKTSKRYSRRDVEIIDKLSSKLTLVVRNAMIFEEIQKQNFDLYYKLAESKAKLRKNDEKINKLEETKDEFISMASHQLRTPLTSVKGYISMVLEGDVGRLNATQKKLLGQAFISSQRMVSMITDMLNVSRLKTGRFILDTSPTKLDEIVKDEVRQLKETAASRGLSIRLSVPDVLSPIMVDESKIRQVVMNFIDNSIYYSKAGSKIEVQVKESENSIECLVHDEGIGVPKDDQYQLFNKFYRASNAKKARPDGTGLGLFMAKKIIIAHGGSMVFSSQVGKGSTFGFILNKKKLTIPEPVGLADN